MLLALHLPNNQRHVIHCLIVDGLLAESQALTSLLLPLTHHPISVGIRSPLNRPAAPLIRNCRARRGSRLRPVSTRILTCSLTAADRRTRRRCRPTATTPRQTRQASPTSRSIITNFTFCQSCAWRFTSTDWTYWPCLTGTQAGQVFSSYDC